MRMIEEYLNLTPEELAAILACTPRQAQQKLTGEDIFTESDKKRLMIYFNFDRERLEELLAFKS